MAEQRTTTASGVPVASDEHSLTVGPNGPTVLQDAYVVQKMQLGRVIGRWSGSLLTLTASYFYGARLERLAGEDDR
jgi:hypothetical protein